MMDFGSALKAMRAGQRVARFAWGGKAKIEMGEWSPQNANDGTWCLVSPLRMLALVTSDESGDIAEPTRDLWEMTQTDILASDWEIVD